MADCCNGLEESSKYFAGVLHEIANNKSSPSLNNGRKKCLKPNALPLVEQFIFKFILELLLVVSPYML